MKCASTPSCRSIRPFSTRGCSGCEDSPNAGGCTRCRGTTPSAAARTSTVPAPLAPLVDRDAERAMLHQLIGAAQGGRGRLALVAGEPGVGKSRLAAEIGDEARARGMRMLIGHCVQMSGTPPYLPYVEIIEQAISRSAQPAGAAGGARRCGCRIARIVPALRRVFPTSRRQSSCRQSFPAAMCGTALVSSSAAPRGASRCCSCSKTCIRPTTRHRCSTEYLAPLLPEMPVLVSGRPRRRSRSPASAGPRDWPARQRGHDRTAQLCTDRPTTASGRCCGSRRAARA